MVKIPQDIKTKLGASLAQAIEASGSGDDLLLNHLRVGKKKTTTLKFEFEGETSADMREFYRVSGVASSRATNFDRTTIRTIDVPAELTINALLTIANLGGVRSIGSSVNATAKDRD